MRLASRVHVHATVRLLLYAHWQAAVRLPHYVCMRAAVSFPSFIVVHAAVRLPSCESERVGATGRLPSCARMRAAVFLPSCAHMRAAVRLPSHVHVHDAVRWPSCASDSVCAIVSLPPGATLCSPSYVRVRAAVRLPSCVHGRADRSLPSSSCARESDASAVQSPCARVRAAMRLPTWTRLHAAMFHGPTSPVRVGKIRHSYPGPERLGVQLVEMSDRPQDPQTGYETRCLVPSCIWTGIECPVDQMVSRVGRQWHPGVWARPWTLLIVRTGPECLPEQGRSLRVTGHRKFELIKSTQQNVPE